MLSSTTDLQPWLAAAFLAAAGLGASAPGLAERAAFAAGSPPVTTTPAPEAPPVTTAPASTPTPDKAPVPKPKPKPKPATTTQPAPRILVPVQPAPPVVTRPTVTQPARPSATAKAKQLREAKAAALARERARTAKAKAQAQARAKAEAAAASASAFRRQPREPFAVTGGPPVLSFARAPAFRGDVRFVALALASVGVALIALAALGARVMGVVAARHPGAANALYDRRTEIAVAGLSLLTGVTIVAAFARWMT